MARSLCPALTLRPVPLDHLTGLSAEALGEKFSGPDGGRWIAAGAHLGHKDAMVMHGQALLDAGDPGGALAWFRIAAKAGDAMGLNMLGRCHEMGWGVVADAAEALGWYRRAAEAGSIGGSTIWPDCCGAARARLPTARRRWAGTAWRRRKGTPSR
ncbi:MAG: sel1 repeat family protein [Rhodospirillales bacterium]|nr:sel1 repeat family protein [Rhodospirillales bacterium]